MLAWVDLGATSIHPSVARHFLFCGTKIIRARRPQDTDDDEAVALAMVVRTGFNTTKGALVRSMLFPKPSGFKFYRDSFRYISVMGCIAGVGFIASFINFVKLGLAWHLIVVRALDLITIVVPPALPATLTIGTNFALARLKKQEIFCISPQRVNVAGKLDVVCFDKTGTLTEDGLDVLGVRLVQHPEIRFSDLLSDSHELLPPSSYDRDPTIDYRVNKTILYTMATCHSLRLVDDELIGDPLDLKMFQFTGWSFEEGSHNTSHFVESGTHHPPPSVARPPLGMEYDIDDAQDSENPLPVELGVLRSFEFVSHLRRASVIVRQWGDTGASVFVKGAPEVMRDICRPSSIPSDFDDLLSYYTHKGFRVIACASKYISKLSWDELELMDRSEAESSLQLTGFIIFENKLKEITTDIIEELNEAKIRNIMCTGDNILTAISVARECDLIDRNSHCFVPHFLEGDKMDPRAQLSWESVDNSIYQLDEHTLLPAPLPAENDTAAPYDAMAISDFTLAVTGDAFRWIIDYGSKEVLQRMLVKGQVFARMSPDEKHELVEKLQSIDYTCGFCGDGANDCGALKAADVGVSLSEAEASVAAPFTSHVFDISCVPILIREGRAALVTSFCCFKYMSLYSAIQFTSVSFLYASASNLGDFQFLFIDLALILPIAIFMGWTGAYPELSKKRPTASLVSRKVLTPLLGQIVLCILVQLVAFETVQRQPWYQPPQLNKQKSSIDNSQNTALFLVSCYQYALSGIVLSVGPPFRQSMTTNAPFCVTLVIALFISLYMLLDPAKWLSNFMDLTGMSLDYELFLLALALAGFVVAYLAEQYVFPGMAKYVGRLKKILRPTHQKKRKQYKVIWEEIELSK
jgi:cation-transporting P-type ATPase 13A2